MARAAIYHFTDKSTQRPGIYQAQLKALEEFAVSLGYPEVDTFCDFSLRKCDHKEFERFLSTADSYDALITKDFYHISKNTEQCMKIMKDLRGKGLVIHTMENGTFVFEPVDPGFSSRASANRDRGTANIIVAGQSYGQGSSREHAAICPMYLGVKCVIVKSIARIHKGNLINHGIVLMFFEASAARVTLRCSATVTRYCNCLKSILYLASSIFRQILPPV